MTVPAARPGEVPVDRPASLGEAYAILAAAPPDARPRPVAGATDVLVQIAAGVGPPSDRLLDLSLLAELRGIDLDRRTDGGDRSERLAAPGTELVIGALTTFTDIRQSAVCREFVPALVSAAATIGAIQIQNRGTLGGNLANASPAGDSLPVVLALDGRVDVGGPRGERTIPAAEFWPAYRRTAMAPDELILRIRFPILPGRETRFRKVGTRRAQAISKVALAIAWTDAPDATGIGPRVWRDVRVALASVAPTPIRSRAAEQVLEASRPTPEIADRAAAALAGDIAPIDDIRSTAAYRRAVAARILHRLIREAGGW